MSDVGERQIALEARLAQLEGQRRTLDERIAALQRELRRDPNHTHRWQRTSNGYSYACDCGDGCGPVGVVEPTLMARGDIIEGRT